jgi:hypothetical protein
MLKQCAFAGKLYQEILLILIAFAIFFPYND